MTHSLDDTAAATYSPDERAAHCKAAAIKRAGAVYDGAQNPPALINLVAAAGLADFSADMAVMKSIDPYEETKEVYFMFAAVVLLALGEEL